MDIKDPVWDDDDSTQADGFKPRQPVEEPSLEPSSAAPSSLEPHPVEQPLIAPPVAPTSDRVRIEPVDSIQRPMAGGGRAAQDRRERSSTSMVVIAVLLFLISVISITVYFFSRPAEPAVVDSRAAESAANGAGQDQNEKPVVDTAPQSSAPVGESTADTLPPAPSNSWSTTSPRRPLANGTSTGASSSQRQAPSTTGSQQPAQTASPDVDVQQRQESISSKSQSTPKASTSPSLRTTAPSNGGTLAQWVVQVHSSPSVDDADEWLQQLQTRNVADGRIEPVTQQGRIWYRVRFGRFATRQEAEQAALQLGYRNAWIDRVR